MTRKQQILNVIDRLPDNVSVEEVIEELFLWEKVRVGLEQADAGNLIPHEEIEREFLSSES